MTEATKQAADPVSASFAAITTILDALTRVQPAIAGPEVRAALDALHSEWDTGGGGGDGGAGGIPPGSVTTAALADGAVTSAKLGGDVVKVPAPTPADAGFALKTDGTAISWQA